MKVTVKNFSEYSAAITDLHKKWGTEHSEVWFRGANRIGNDLLPGIVWRKMREYEDNMSIDFNISYTTLIEGNISNNWELYALMQHYGLPTRLLDWTKSPLIALYFCLEKGEFDESNNRCVWAIDPFELNEICSKENTIYLPSDGDNGGIVSLQNYLPVHLRDNGSGWLLPFPIAIEPPFSNKRIQAQQGCFTVHGLDDKPIQTYFEDANSEKLWQIIIPESSRESMLEELHNLGISEEAIYQDLNALSNRIRRVYEKIKATADQKEEEAKKPEMKVGTVNELET